MAQNVTLYNLLISCPGDIKKEVTLIEAAVDEFNELYAETLGITIKTRHWSKSSYAQSGGKPQALLNEQFVKERIEGGANEKAVLRLFINCPFVCINFDFFWLNKARQLYMDF